MESDRQQNTPAATELSGKGVVLDVRARYVDGHQYNIEMQVQRQRNWVRFFQHWQEDSIMARVTHEPVLTRRFGELPGWATEWLTSATTK